MKGEAVGGEEGVSLCEGLETSIKEEHLPYSRVCHTRHEPAHLPTKPNRHNWSAELVQLITYTPLA
jgi:hypothetical protein